MEGGQSGVDRINYRCSGMLVQVDRINYRCGWGSVRCWLNEIEVWIEGGFMLAE